MTKPTQGRNKRKREPEVSTVGRKKNTRNTKVAAQPDPPANANAVQNANSTFRFLSLPAELRNSVYELALMTPIQWSTAPPIQWSTAPDSNGMEKVPHRNALLFVNRQIHNEMLPLLYGQTLTFRDDKLLCKTLSMMTAAHRRLLKDIVLQTVQSASFMKKSAVLLRDAARSLRSLQLDWYGHSRYSHHHPRTFHPQSTATHIYMAMYVLLDAITDVRGIEAALDTVRFGDANYQTIPAIPARNSQTMPKQERTRLFNLYRNELKEKVMRRQKRDMSKNLGLEFKSMTLRDRVVEWHKD